MGHTNNSAALPLNGVTLVDAVASVGKVILSGDVLKGDRGLSDARSRKGFRETGRGGASRGEESPDDTLGDAARLRKGLLEERVSGSRAGTGRESAKQDC